MRNNNNKTSIVTVKTAFNKLIGLLYSWGNIDDDSYTNHHLDNKLAYSICELAMLNRLPSKAKVKLFKSVKHHQYEIKTLSGLNILNKQLRLQPYQIYQDEGTILNKKTAFNSLLEYDKSMCWNDIETNDALALYDYARELKPFFNSSAKYYIITEALPDNIAMVALIKKPVALKHAIRKYHIENHELHDADVNKHNRKQIRKIKKYNPYAWFYYYDLKNKWIVISPMSIENGRSKSVKKNNLAVQHEIDKYM